MAKIPSKANITNQLSKTTEELNSIKTILRSITEATGDFNDILKEAQTALKNTSKYTEVLNAKLKVTTASELNIKDINNQLYKIKVQQGVFEEKESKLSNTQKINVQKILDLNNDILESQKELIRLKSNDKTTENQLKIQADIINQKIAQLQLEEHNLDINEAEYLVYKKISDANKDIESGLKSQLSTAKEFSSKIGITGALFKKLGVDISIGTKALEAMEDAFEDNQSRSKIFLAGLKAGIKESLIDPAIQFSLVMKAQSAIWSGIKAVFGFIKKVATETLNLIVGWNTAIFEFGKNLGIGSVAAKGLQESFLSMVNSSQDLFFTTKEYREAYSALTEASGLFLKNNKETTETAAILQRQFGLTAADLGSIMENSALSGKSFKDTYYTIDSIRQIEGSRNKSLLSQKQIVGEISKVSSLVLLNFKGNVPALTAAVVKAHALGLSLDQVNSTANGFLDFETSIGKEFEAQLITGKDLNLQRLRYLSLTHDTAGLMAEIGKRIPSMLDFEKMNTIERQAYAEALNMSEDSLAEIIKKQELVRKYGIAENATAGETYNQLVKQGYTYKQIEGILTEQGAAQDRSASIADKWNSVIEKIKDNLSIVLEKYLGPIIDSFINMVNSAGGFKTIMEKIEPIIKGIAHFFVNLPKAISGLMHAAATFFEILGAIQTIAAIALAFVPGAEGAAVGLGIGAAKSFAVGAGLDIAAGKVSDFFKPEEVSPNAISNQVGFRDNTSAATPSTTPTQNRVQPVTIQLNSTIQQEGHKVGQANQTVYYNLPAADSTNTHPYHTGGQTGASQTK